MPAALCSSSAGAPCPFLQEQHKSQALELQALSLHHLEGHLPQEKSIIVIYATGEAKGCAVWDNIGRCPAGRQSIDRERLLDVCAWRSCASLSAVLVG